MKVMCFASISCHILCHSSLPGREVCFLASISTFGQLYTSKTFMRREKSLLVVVFAWASSDFVPGVEGVGGGPLTACADIGCKNREGDATGT